MIDLDAIKARAEAATPGPWEYAEAGTFKRGSFSLDEYFVRRPEDDVSIAADIIDPDTCEPSEALAAFIAHAREDVPALVAEVERLQAALRGIYGTVSVKPTWERQWPHVNALVREALGLE